MKSSRALVRPVDVLEQEHRRALLTSLRRTCAGREQVLLIARGPALRVRAGVRGAVRRSGAPPGRGCARRRRGGVSRARTRASSSSRIPASSATISASAQKATPSPYARQRPRVPPRSLRARRCTSRTPTRGVTSRCRRSTTEPGGPSDPRRSRGTAPSASGARGHAEERRLDSGRTSPTLVPRDDPGRPPEGDRLGLALQLVGPGVLVDDRGVGRALGGLRPRTRSRARPTTGCAQRCSRGPGDHPLPDRSQVDGRLSGQHAGTRRELWSAHLVAEGRTAATSSSAARTARSASSSCGGRRPIRPSRHHR